MHIVHVALGGCIKAAPVAYGLTEDTGGHIGYLLGAAMAQGRRTDVRCVEIVTRCFDGFGAPYDGAGEALGEKVHLRRLSTRTSGYLSKEALDAEIPSFAEAFETELAGRPACRRPTVIHAHFADAAEAVRPAAERFGIPVVYTAHSLAADKASTCGTPGLSARIERESNAIRTSAAIIASSRDEAERQLPHYRGADAARIRRIMPGVEALGPDAPERATALLAPFLRDMGRPTILAVARPVRKKNLPTLIDIFAEAGLSDRANLVIVAGLRDGIETGAEETLEVHRDLFAAIDRHDLHGSVALPKRHDAEDLAALYRHAARTGGVFTNPALTEPFGLTIMEAAAAGLPVVATSHGGPGDIIRLIGHGTTADPADAAAFGTAIAQLIDEPVRWRRAARAALDGVREWTWDRYAEHACALYREVATARRPALRVPLALDARGMRRAASTTLLVTDIDNTLTGDRAAAHRFAHWRKTATDHVFAVATGRSISEARFVLQRWDLPMPDAWITSVGSEIYLPDIAGRLREETAYGAATSGDWRPDDVLAVVDGIGGLTRQADIEFRARKLSWVYEAPEVPDRVRLALEAEGLAAHVVASHGGLLDVLPRHAGKGAAALWLADRLGIDRGALVVAGDSGNDIDLFDAAPKAIAVANRSVELDPVLDRPNVILARRSFADGVLEGLQAGRLAHVPARPDRRVPA